MRGAIPAALATAALALAAAGAAASLPAARTAPGPVHPAESGATDSAATTGPLAIGARVVDRSGALVGNVVRLTTDKSGVDVAKIRLGEDVWTIPVADLFMRGGEVLSSVSLDDLKHGRGGG